MKPGTPRMLRGINDRAALDLLLEHGPLSRTRLGELTGLSKPTASQLLTRLEADGLVVASGSSRGGRGPGPSCTPSIRAPATWPRWT
ncbi:MAG: MarR family transcriptional regulator [Nocardioides sp.]